MDKRFVGRYTIADMFDRTFAMIRRTWKTALVVGAATMIVPSILVGWGLVRTMRNIATVIERTGGEGGPEIIWSVLQSVGIMPLFGALVGLAYLFAGLVVTDAVRGEALDGGHTIGESARRIFREALLPVIGQAVLKGLIFGAVIGAPVALLVLLTVVVDATGPLIALAVLVYIVAIGVSVWLYVSLFFSETAVVFDRAGVFGGLRESMMLVRRSWWRVLGYSLLLQIVLSFVIGLVSTPIVGASMLPSVTRIIDLAASRNVSDAQVFELMRSFSGLGVAAAIGILVQQLVSMLVVPVYFALLFIDLKVRRGDLDAGDGSTAADA